MVCDVQQTNGTGLSLNLPVLIQTMLMDNSAIFIFQIVNKCITATNTVTGAVHPSDQSH